MKNYLEKIATRPYAVLGAFILVVLAVYIPIYQIGYISDDWGFVYQMEHSGWSAFTYNFTDKFFIPVSHALGTIQYLLTGGNATAQHIIQVLIHGIIAWQIFMLCKDVARRTNYKDFVSIGLIAGLLFIINPFQVEAVAWLASKSYGYTLLFSLLALRVLIKDNDGMKKHILFWTLMLIAIHCKEWAYALPFIAICLMKITNIKITNYFWIGFLLTIATAILLRYFALGTFIGGYESGQSFNISTVALHVLAYLVKFTTYIRLASTEFLPLPLLAFMSVAFTLFFVVILFKDRIKKTTIFYFSALTVITLLPVAGLEITSFISNQSDRYSYFTLVPFSILYGYVFINLKKWFGIISLFALVGIFTFYSLNYNKRWVESSVAQYTFLESLLPAVKNNSRVLLYNVPDTFNDIYCIRNGIEPFLKVNGKEVDIEIYQRQDFFSINGGSVLRTDSSFLTIEARNTYTTFPKDVISKNTIPFNWEWLNEFDNTLVYANTAFTSINN